MSFGSSIGKAIASRPLLVGGTGLLVGGGLLSTVLGGSDGSNPISTVVDTFSNTFSLLPTLVPLALIGGTIFYITK